MISFAYYYDTPDFLILNLCASDVGYWELYLQTANALAQ
jgi:hypothetical protein